MRINQNIGALNALRNLSVNETAQGKSLEKLSSGFRINRAADDAAGLVDLRRPALAGRRSEGCHAQRSGRDLGRADR